MQLINFITQNVMGLFSAIIAVCSLFVALFVERRTRRQNLTAFRREADQNHTQMVLDIDRQLIQYPELWAIYDTHPLSKHRKAAPGTIESGRREAFIYATSSTGALIRQDPASTFGRSCALYSRPPLNVPGFPILSSA